VGFVGGFLISHGLLSVLGLESSQLLLAIGWGLSQNTYMWSLPPGLGILTA